MKKSIHSLFLFFGLALVIFSAACDSLIFDDQGDCSVHYRVPFTFTNNILNVDAFSSQVTSVTLYVYDSEGKLAFRKTDSGTVLSQPGYAMDVMLSPGIYTMLAWAEGTPLGSSSVSFTIEGGENPASITDITAILPLEGENGNALYCDKDITPLFHGFKTDIECAADAYGNIMLPAIDLTKDTNVIEVILQNLEGTPIAEDALTVSIEASNSRLDWNNAVVGNEAFSYRPWSIIPLSGNHNDITKADDMSGILTELTTGRLMADRKPMLVVNRTRDGKDIIRLDLIKYLLLVKGHYLGSLTNQQYLDRMDRHVLAFFIDADLNWYTAAGININGWHVVPPQDDNL